MLSGDGYSRPRRHCVYENVENCRNTASGGVVPRINGKPRERNKNVDLNLLEERARN